MDTDNLADTRTAQAPSVLVVGGKLKIVQKARRLGLDVIYFQRPEFYTDDHREHVQASFLFDYRHVGVSVELARAVHRSFGLRHAVSLTEDGLMVTGHVNDALGLPGTGAHVAALFKDKWLMRKHLAERDLSTVAAELLSDHDGLRRFGARHGWPVVVKPTDASASVAVFLAKGPEWVEQACWRAERVRLSSTVRHAAVNQFMIEEFVPGPEISVEALSFGGHHVVLAVTEKLLADGSFVEIGHALPARLDSVVERQVVSCTASFLDAVGLRDGPSHTEFRLGPKGPQLIESHNRVGGDRIHDLVEAACGVDQDSVALGWPLGMAPVLAAPPPVRCAAATRFLVADPGEVVAIDGVEEVRRHPSVVALDVAVAVGDVVPPLRTSWDRAGQVVVTAQTTAEATTLVAQLAAQIKIATRTPAASS